MTFTKESGNHNAPAVPFWSNLPIIFVQPAEISSVVAPETRFVMGHENKNSLAAFQLRDYGCLHEVANILDHSSFVQRHPFQEKVTVPDNIAAFVSIIIKPFCEFPESQSQNIQPPLGGS